MGWGIRTPVKVSLETLTRDDRSNRSSRRKVRTTPLSAKFIETLKSWGDLNFSQSLRVILRRLFFLERWPSG
ncbi:MAG TPA: hypothetical protein PKA79_01795 [Oligoflexia bacterium]|nr:hypothetical protein [Oligoflexia bacterium]